MTTIAVAGKGGTGKTTISALLVDLLAQNNVVLAIDADPSSNLHLALGLELCDTVGGVREEMRTATKPGNIASGIPKMDYVELKINEALVEGKNVDLLAMGRSEGPGCYCAANHLLRTCVDRLAKSYKYIVIDNEAGLEHLSRQTTQDVDYLIIVSEPTVKSIITAKRVKDLVKELNTRVGEIGLVINRLNNGLPPEVAKEVAASGLEVVGTIPIDARVMELDAAGRPITLLPPDSPARKAVQELARRMGIT